MRYLRSLIFFVLLANPAFAWLGGPGGGGGGGGGLSGGGTLGRIPVWTGATSLGDSFLTSPGGGTIGYLDATLTLRLNVFHSGTDTILQQQTGDLILRDPGGVDRLLIQNGLPPSMPTGLMLDPIVAPVADATRDIIFKDTADGIIKARKSTADGGALVSLEGGGGGSSTFFEESFTPTIGQTVFALSNPYVGATGLSVVIINDATYPASRYTIVGSTFTWLNTPFSLDGTDLLTVKYQVN